MCVNICSGNLFLKVELKVGSEKTVQNCWCNSPTQTGMDFPNEEQKQENWWAGSPCNSWFFFQTPPTLEEMGHCNSVYLSEVGDTQVVVFKHGMYVL